MTKRALIFPGQGSQFIGMGLPLFEQFQEAREVFQEVDDVLSQKLSDLMFYGNAEQLTLTQNAQPAIMATSIAVFRVLKKYFTSDIAVAVAGHSLGEYSALCAAGSISLRDAALLLKCRGNAMSEATLGSSTKMLALIGVNISDAEKIADKASVRGICEVANDNGANQVVLSGETSAIRYAGNIAVDEFFVKKVMELNVQTAFHSSMLKSVQPIMRDVLMSTSIKRPVVDVISNYNAMVYQKKDDIVESLVKQIVSRVRWKENIEVLKEKLDVEEFIELGPGNVLGKLLKRSYSGISVFSVCTAHELESMLEKLQL